MCDFNGALLVEVKDEIRFCMVPLEIICAAPSNALIVRAKILGAVIWSGGFVGEAFECLTVWASLTPSEPIL